MTRRARVVVGVWLAASMAVGGVGCQRTFHRLTSLEPISASNRPAYPYVVGLDNTGRPVLLLLEQSSRLDYYRERKRSKTEMEADLGPILSESENKPGGPYSFFLKRPDLPRIQGVLTKALGDPLTSIRLKLLGDSPRQKTQTVLLTYRSDDFTYVFSYKVERGEVIPVAYCDIVTRDGFAAFVHGTGLFLAMALLGLVAYAVAELIPGSPRTR